jgi:two-component system NtrC family sensor kinase
VRLAKRLGIALILGVFLVLAGFAYVRLQREVQLFDSDMRRDHRTLGETLAVAVAHTWESEGEQAALALVNRVSAARADVSARWVSLDRDPPARQRPAIDPKLLGGLDTSRTAHAVQLARSERGTESEHEDLYTYVAVPMPGRPLGAIEIRESLAARDSYLDSTVRNTIVASLVMALVCGVVAIALGAHFVGRPVSRLIDKARRIGAGELADPVGMPKKDELGELAGELDLMSERLAEARRATEAETAARIATLEQLRHAERLTTVGRLASALAHEVGTPLNVVAGHAQMIAKGRVTGEAVTDSATVIGAQCARMTKIVRQVLDYARRRPPKTLHADLKDVAQGTVELLEPMARAQKVEIKADLEPRALAEVDASQIQQALINLIMNAVQASKPGGQVEVSLTRTRAHPGGDASAPEVCCYLLSVQDEGCGIPEDNLQRLFEPFFTTKPSGEGTGLGLSITNDIVTEHGGWLSVRSQLGEGSRFDLYFPAPEEPRNRDGRASSSSEPGEG